MKLSNWIAALGAKLKFRRRKGKSTIIVNEVPIKKKIKRSPWTAEDERKLTFLLGDGKYYNEISKIMSRTPDAIRTRVYERENKTGVYRNPVDGYNLSHPKAVAEAIQKKTMEYNKETADKVTKSGQVHLRAVIDAVNPDNHDVLIKEKNV